MLLPRWLAFFIGGNFKQQARKITHDGFTMQLGGGYGWRPNIFRLIIKYYREGWNKHYSLYKFLCFGDHLSKVKGAL